jgi:hypothetical protein
LNTSTSDTAGMAVSPRASLASGTPNITLLEKCPHGEHRLRRPIHAKQKVPDDPTQYEDDQTTAEVSDEQSVGMRQVREIAHQTK